MSKWLPASFEQGSLVQASSCPVADASWECPGTARPHLASAEVQIADSCPLQGMVAVGTGQNHQQRSEEPSQNLKEE